MSREIELIGTSSYHPIELSSTALCDTLDDLALSTKIDLTLAIEGYKSSDTDAAIRTQFYRSVVNEAGRNIEKLTTICNALSRNLIILNELLDEAKEALQC